MLQVILNTGLQSQHTLLYQAFILHFGEVHLLLHSFVTTIFVIGHLFRSDSSFLLAKYHWLYNYILANFIFVGSEVSGVLPFSTNPKIYLKCARHSSNSYKSRYQPLKILLMPASLLSISLSKSFFFNWDSLHARLNSHYKAWSYKKKKHKKIKAHRKSV